ncbi:MAG: hypothetical protein H7330_00370, partial [Hymenobacteraceae bacterium]|nr:hypothetical protein [Hymenobacteraceae bacterium]
MLRARFLFASLLLLPASLLAGATPTPWGPGAGGDPPVMRLTDKQPAPAFTTSDVLGQPVSREGLRGKRVLLSFMRDAGCCGARGGPRAPPPAAGAASARPD